MLVVVRVRKNALAQLGALTPVKFENFTFDLLQLIGLENLVWRTPGADNGRDLEGILRVRDLSGSMGIQKWYVECKRYSTSVDWATVWKKAAFAQNHDADFLLLVTNSTLSPDCVTEVTTWNANKRKPSIRCWGGHDLVSLVERYSSLAIKYGLKPSPAEKDRAFVKLAQETSKITQAAYGAHSVGSNSSKALEAAAALSELLTVRMADIDLQGAIYMRPYDNRADAFEWCEGEPNLTPFDGIGMRAILATSRFVLDADVAVLSIDKGKVVASFERCRGTVSDSARSLLDLIGFWSDFELETPQVSSTAARILISHR